MGSVHFDPRHPSRGTAGSWRRPRPCVSEPAGADTELSPKGARRLRWGLLNAGVCFGPDRRAPLRRGRGASALPGERDAPPGAALSSAHGRRGLGRHSYLQLQLLPVQGLGVASDVATGIVVHVRRGVPGRARARDRKAPAPPPARAPRGLQPRSAPRTLEAGQVGGRSGRAWRLPAPRALAARGSGRLSPGARQAHLRHLPPHGCVPPLGGTRLGPQVTPRDMCRPLRAVPGL